MQIFQQIQLLRDALTAERKQGKSIAFVPTMGNLHEGHLQLVRLAKEHCDIVVVSIFVNPLQFGLTEDWELYPRTHDADCNKLESEQTDYVFCPTETEMYPNGMETQTKVEVSVMVDILCGASRPGHFLGVTTVVAKLFNMVEPDEAIFGIKDYQQLTVIKRMTEDLAIPIKITAAPIARAKDGLALSSRNTYLTKEERLIAPQLYQSLLWVKKQIEADNNDFQALEAEAKKQLSDTGMKADYLSIIEAQTLNPATKNDKNIAVLGAVFLGNTRLIDNLTIKK